MPYEKLRELGMTLPTPPAPVGNFLPYTRYGNLVFLSGQGPVRHDGVVMKGKVGSALTTEEATLGAQYTGLVLLSVLEQAAGSLESVTRISKVFGMVNSTADYLEQPQVINGCSDLLVEILGDRGRHARSAVGMGALPGNICVEIELIAELNN